MLVIERLVEAGRALVGIQPSDRRCATCRFAQVTIADNEEPYLQCRRYPPLLVVVDGSTVRMFAQVSADEWCGEWRADVDAQR